MAHSDNTETKVVNLFIPGCSLYTHDENIKNDNKNYSYELNGKSTERMISVKEALIEENWDAVTMQQASHDSGIEETYFPYITDLSEYIKKYAPDAKQYIHKTWAYEKDSNHGCFARYDRNQRNMYDALTKAYNMASGVLRIEIIPVGDIRQTLRATPEFDYPNGGISLCRDGFHLSLDYGRYAASATWYKYLFKRNISDNKFIPEDTDKKLINIIKETVDYYSEV